MPRALASALALILNNETIWPFSQCCSSPLGSLRHQVPEDGGSVGGFWSRIAGLL